jgi:hypothetical protein
MAISPFFPLLAAAAPNPIAQAFQRLISRIEPTARDVSLFDAHADSVKRALETHVGANRVDVMGSARRGSAIHGRSDVDLLAVLPIAAVRWGDALKSSDTVLKQIRDVLAYRYHSTAMGRDGQAIVVQFGDGTHPVDVVPAVWSHHAGPYNYPIHVIPDGAGDWMPTSPDTHNRFIAEADARAGGKQRYVARIFKYWRDTRMPRVPVSGFHVEMLLASNDFCAGARSYAAIFRDLLVEISNRKCAALNDPCGISGRIQACNTDAKRQQALRTTYAAAEHADSAVDAERAGDIREALRQWDLVFNGQFPR